MEKRTFKLCESGLPHYYVFDKLFILFDEAMSTASRMILSSKRSTLLIMQITN